MKGEMEGGEAFFFVEKPFKSQKQIYMRFPFPFRLKPLLNQGAKLSVLDPNSNHSRQA